MFKRFLIFVISVFFLSGCMPSPIEKHHENAAKKNMISRSLANSGNSFRINQKIYSAKKGEKILIAYFGSSVFSFNSNEKSVAVESFERIKSLFGNNLNLYFDNFSFKGINSELGNLLFDKEISSKNPDIIFLDFALFDSKYQPDREAFEKIVRKCLMLDNSPQVVIILNSDADGNSKQDYMEQIARYYNLPVINIAAAILPEISSGRMNSDSFFEEDGFTFSDFGIESVSDFIENYLKNAQKADKDSEYLLPPPMNVNVSFEDVHWILPEDLQSDNDGSYTRKKSDNKYFPSKIEFMPETGNKPFLFTLTADDIYLIYPVSKYRNGIFEIYVNGKKVSEINVNSDDENDKPAALKILSLSESEKTVVAIKMQDENLNNENINITPSDRESVSGKNLQKTFELWGVAYSNSQKDGQN